MNQVLAFLTAHWDLVALVVTTACSLVAAWLKHQRADRAERVAQALAEGTRTGLADISAGKVPLLAVFDGVREAAAVLGVSEHVGDHLDSIAAPIIPIPTSGPTSGPTVPPPSSPSPPQAPPGSTKATP